MTGSLSAADLCAIVVTYHPEADCAARLRALAADGVTVIVVDNGSAAAEISELAAMDADGRLELIRHPQNLGIAVALNRGTQRAAARGFTWVLLLDQDTDVTAGAVRSLAAVAATYPAPSALAIVGSRFEDAMQRVSAPLPGAPADAAWEDVEAVITSGSLLSLAAYARIGPFREDFFIDYVDIEYCVRARRAGFHVLRTKQSLIRHAVGQPREGRFLWLRKWTTNHSADRRYYIARNDTVMLRESGAYPHGRWALKSASRRVQMCKRIAMFEQQKAAKVAATLTGWWDGVRGAMGPRRRG